MRRAVWILVALFAVCLAVPAGAAGGKAYVGTNLGLAHYVPEEGDGLTTFGWPHGIQAASHLFAPGLRIGFGLDERNSQSIYLDTGLSIWSGGGSSTTMLQFMGGYEYGFGGGPVEPYLTGGVGYMSLSEDGHSISNPVLGVGLGIRHVLAHGGGAVRAEFHLDHQFEAKFEGDPVMPSLNAIGLKLGFDLNL